MQISPPPLDLGFLSPVIAYDGIQIPDAYSRYTNFKYRLWFTYYIWYTMYEEEHSLPWFVTACVANDLWFWKEEDEECIEEFAKALPSESFRKTVIPMDSEYWNEACQALEMRQSRAMASPLTHVTPQIRLYFMAWLMLAGPLRRDIRLEGRVIDIDRLVIDWATSLNLHDGVAEPCDICGVSHLLPIWIETMLQVYSLNDLRSIPWHDKCDCLGR
jgi:hypothetical protein